MKECFDFIFMYSCKKFELKINQIVITLVRVVGPVRLVGVVGLV